MTPEQTQALKVLRNMHLDPGMLGTVKAYVQTAGQEQSPMQDDLNGIIAYACKRMADGDYPARAVRSCPTCKQDIAT